MADLSAMSDEELRRLYQQQQKASPPKIDMSKMSDDELRALHAGKKLLEFPDAPTTAYIDVPGVSVFNGKDVTGTPGIPFGSAAALKFGTMTTDNPRARQEIYAKHLPGAKAVDDKFGNPMVEYQGKKYYTSRPGEFDAMDAGRLALGTAASLPAMALAPATLPGVMAAGGLTMAGQSLGEDAVTRMSGGTSQDIDVGKAATSGLLGAALPFGVSKLAMPIAGRINEAIRPGLSDEAIHALGIDPSRLTPELRETISRVARRTFGDPQAVGAAYRQGLGQEFRVPLTRGEISQAPGQVAREQTLAGPGNPEAQSIMMANREAQDAQRTAAQRMLRGDVGGPMTQEQAGQVLRQGYNAADQQAERGVDQLYQAAKDPATLQRMGVSPTVPMPYVNQLGNTVRSSLERTGPGRVIVNDDFPSLAPNAARALAQIDRWTQGGLGPRGAADINWEGIDNLRQVLGQYRTAAYSTTNKVDQSAMQRIMQGFDDHFAPLNSLLGEARAAHAQRMLDFVPGQQGQDKATTRVLEALQSDEPGTAVVNTIFGPSVKKGEAVQMIDHLNNQVFPRQPAAQQAIKEQALRRLTVDPRTGETLSPQKTITAMRNALDGEAESPIYQRLFSPDEMARLRRFYDMTQSMADARRPINPPGSGLIIQAVLKHGMSGGLGAAIGGGIGTMFGAPVAGGVVGSAVGTGASHVIPRFQAQNAIRPPANYTPPASPGRAGLLGGLPAAEATRDQLNDQPGPADRLMRGLLMGGP